MFENCISLSSLHNIYEWNTNKAEKVKSVIYNCISLIYLPNIQKYYKNE